MYVFTGRVTKSPASVSILHVSWWQMWSMHYRIGQSTWNWSFQMLLWRTPPHISSTCVWKPEMWVTRPQPCICVADNNKWRLTVAMFVSASESSADTRLSYAELTCNGTESATARLVLLLVLLAKFQIEWRHILTRLVRWKLEDPVTRLLTVYTTPNSYTKLDSDTTLDNMTTFTFVQPTQGAWVTAARRSLVPLPMSLDFSIGLILPATPWLRGQFSLWQKRVPGTSLE
jgi:hypothetical protein